MADREEWIRIRGARTHNLHSLDLDLPRGRLIVFSGPSGSGKSSLAFDTLFAEGQRRYLETLRGATRSLFDQLQRPDVDSIDGLPPTLCVAQRAGAPRPRSTLATVTEVHDYLRLLWARLGIPHCPECGLAISRHSVAQIVRQTVARGEGRKIYLLAPLVRQQPGPHKEAFQTIRQGGFLRARIDGNLCEVRDTPKLSPKAPHTIEVVVDRLVVREGFEERLTESLGTAIKLGAGRVIVTDIDDGDWHDEAYSTRFICPRCDVPISELEPRLFHFNNPHGACPICTGLGQVWEIDPRLLVSERARTLAQTLSRLLDELPEEIPLAAPDRKLLESWPTRFPRPDGNSWQPTDPLADWPEEAVQALLFGSDDWPGWVPPLNTLLQNDADDVPRKALQSMAGFVTCPECRGARLNRVARAVRFDGLTLPDVTARTVAAALELFPKPDGEQREPSGSAKIRTTLLHEIHQRIHFLNEVGLGYLTLDRPAPTLSGGEMQRARLASQLGGGLFGLCYILDEPTVGLHPSDTERLIRALRALQERGNTVVVVEHDEEVIRQADYLVDIGPGAGRDGGRLLAAGTVAEVMNNPASNFASRRHAGVAKPQASAKPQVALVIRGARHHNLRDIDVEIPLGRLVCLTGVSGSGKSSLGREVLCWAARRRLGLLAPPPGEHDGIDGLEHIDKVVEVDQASLGRSSRSNPASYTGAFDEIRRVFAGTKTAKLRGYQANRFSFNVKGGRCEECQGQGIKRVALQFLPDLDVPCTTCGGRRFNRATFEVLYKGKSIADVLDLSIAEALEFFGNIPTVVPPLRTLVDVGLGYLALGQPASTLSGGEAQRVKLAKELARPSSGRTLFLLDEPTTGLHFADVARLLDIFRKLVAAGNTLVVIEHHPELIAAADWVIDLGPGAGAAGGQVVVAGTPADVAACKGSVTGVYVARTLDAATDRTSTT